jgi:hypothetical protein
VSGKKLLLPIVMLLLTAVSAFFFLTETLFAQAQGPISRAAEECVTYGSGSALQMCFHKFTDGTRCVAAGGGGLASVGAGAALQCDFK